MSSPTCPNCHKRATYYSGGLGYEAIRCFACRMEYDLNSRAKCGLPADCYDPKQTQRIVLNKDNPCNAMFVLGETERVIFVRIPPALSAHIDGCSCDYCKAHPDNPPAWDTLAIPKLQDTDAKDYGFTYTGHMPEVSSIMAGEFRRFRQKIKKEGRF